MRIDTLKRAVPIIGKLGKEVGLKITEEEIARRLNLSHEQFNGYLNAEENTPKELLSQLWQAYDDLFKAVQRSNRSGRFRSSIASLKNKANAIGMPISDEEIIEKIGINREQFDAYLYGEVDTPDEVVSRIRSAWPELHKNTLIAECIKICEVMEDDPDEDNE